MKQFTIKYHAANANIARIPELDIRPMHECEGGGYYISRQQAEYIVGMQETLEKIASGSFREASTIATDSDWKRFVDHIQALARSARIGKEYLNPSANTGNKALDELIKKSCEWFNGLSAEEQQDHRRQQMASWVRGEMELAKDSRFK